MQSMYVVRSQPRIQWHHKMQLSDCSHKHLVFSTHLILSSSLAITHLQKPFTVADFSFDRLHHYSTLLVKKLGSREHCHYSGGFPGYPLTHESGWQLRSQSQRRGQCAGHQASEWMPSERSASSFPGLTLLQCIHISTVTTEQRKDISYES